MNGTLEIGRPLASPLGRLELPTRKALEIGGKLMNALHSLGQILAFPPILTDDRLDSRRARLGRSAADHPALGAEGLGLGRITWG